MVDVRLESIVKRFPRGGDTPAVDDVNITVNDGEFFTLLGPSGCGKTTTLRMVAGFYFPTSGTISFGDDDVTRRPPNKRDTGMVFQNYALFPHLTVEQNVAYGLKTRKVARGRIAPRVSEALEQVHLSGYSKRRIDQLSGGQQQRVALARALVIRPQTLLLDEPLSNLDAKLREETRTEIRRIQREAGTTSLYVTHDQDEAMAMSDRIAVMEAGRVQQLGTPTEIYHRPANRFVATFIGRSNVLALPVEHAAETEIEVRLPGGATARAAAPQGHGLGVGDTAYVSIRPEYVQLAPPRTPGAASGVVKEVEFTGMTSTVTLEVGDLTLMAKTIDMPGTVFVGDAVGVVLPAERLWVVQP
ncbi:ABC transporter ATP-binding protein [Georgenia subflava]|uniref:ATP-binding cassette domain-containing protein n=1 Tax=Georgenia subflava TaxID=1622177 RepID=A0A6N7EDY5_9MICO|nr:ABC transporter ATP-binding protein [Georgenia subflava]MPV35551.1 ATP-binding cassette domain-containing protein [Georgenia subflava]